jgi:GT2 family glycosyltransferase
MTGVSFVVPVYNGERTLTRALDSVFAQKTDLPVEVIAVEDGSTDGSPDILRALAEAGRITLVKGERRGAAAAINTGIRHARHDVICQVDQDVVLGDNWLAVLVAALDADPRLAAAQAYYGTDRGSTVWARVMGYDLEHRYSRIAGETVDHVCTGTTAYRKAALVEVGLFDETFGYGYDNDMSYRLAKAGWRMRLCRAAHSTHLWREDLGAYLRQQYGIGYGRLDLVGKHGRYRGDDPAGVWMILHAPLMLLALVAALGATLLAALHLPGASWAGLTAATVLALLALERAAVGICAARLFGDRACLYFPVAHLLRDVIWVGALVAWAARFALRRPRRPTNSMG